MDGKSLGTEQQIYDISEGNKPSGLSFEIKKLNDPGT